MANSMTIEKCLQKAYARSRGKDILSTPLASGDTKYNQLLDIIDGKQRDWQNTDGVSWQSLWQLFTLGSTVSATDTFALPTTMREPSEREEDSVVVTAVDGTKFYYDIVDADKLRRYQIDGDYTKCAIQGTNLVFARPFVAADKQIGGSIKVPGYGFVPTIDLTTNTASTYVSVDDPMWLVYSVAAEFVRTDLVRQNQYGNLIDLATDRMDAMIEKNGSDQTDEILIEEDMTDLSPDNASGAWN